MKSRIIFSNIPSRKFNLPFGILGFLSAVNFQQRVLIIPLELMAVAYFIITFKRSHHFQYPELRKFLKALFLSAFLLIFLQIIIDLYFVTPMIETLKTTASIFTLVALIYSGINLLTENDIKLKSFLLGYVSSSLLTFFFFSNDYIKTDSWKFLFANSTTIFVLVALGFIQKARFFKIIVIISLSFIHLLLGSRSAALLTLLTVVALILPHRLKSGKRGLILILLSIFLVSSLTAQLYQFLSLSGNLGISQQEKAQKQFQSGPLLLFARSELLYELGAIKDSPWVGKGSDPILSQSLLANVSQNQERFGLKVKETAAYTSYLKNERIPLHSMLFSTWVQTGIVGVYFWLSILGFFIKYFRVVIYSKSCFNLVASYFHFSALWSLFFSPLGAGSRLFIALAVTCVARVIVSESEFN